MNYDVIILGAGGAGMMCAIHAGRRSRNVLLLDHATRLGGKILISGGGRCNFTNLGASPAQYVSKNPHFSKSALSRYTPDDFIQMVRNHGIAFHEKKLGQLFCDDSAKNIVQLLKSECDQAGAYFKLGCKIQDISRKSNLFSVQSSEGTFSCTSLVIATGGLSIPKIGATGFGYKIARQFGLEVVDTVPALDGFIFSDFQKTPVSYETDNATKIQMPFGSGVVRPASGLEMHRFKDLSGVSLDCIISCNGISFRENILFTHTGLSGPAALQASLHWNSGDPVFINLLPELPNRSLFEWLLEKKKKNSRAIVKNLLSELLPARFAELFCEVYFPTQVPLPQVSEKALKEFSDLIHSWKIVVSGTVGYSKAEVTRGGVDTHELSSKTLEAKKVPGLYFIGEVVDVTGWLGGYNFQWAWASGWAAGQVV